MSQRVRPSLLFAMAAALACTGCQPTGTGGVQEKARDTAKVFLQTCAENPLAAFDLLSAPAREDFFKGGTGFQGCLRILGFTPSGTKSVRDLFRESRVEAVERRGQDQFFSATVRSPDGERAELDLELEGDRFRISNPPAPSAEEKAREAATELLKACADEDRAKVLELLSEPARKTVLKASSALDGCAEILDVRKLPGGKPSEDKLRELFRDARVESLERSITDQTFKAKVKTATGESLEAELEPDPASERYLVSIPKEGKAREAATEFPKACADEDRATVLDLLSEPARTEFLKAPSVLDGCAEVAGVTKLPGPKPGEDRLRELFAGARVESLEPSPTDETFKATVKTPAGETLEVELEPDPKNDRYLVSISRQDKARAAATELLKACAAEDRGKAVDLLSDPALTEFLKGTSVLDGCAEVAGVTKLPGPKPGEDRLRELFAGARVESLEPSPTDETFKATVKTPAGDTLEVELEPDPASDRYLVSISKEDKARAAATELLKACADEDKAKVLDVLSVAARNEFINAKSVLDGCAEVAGVKRVPGGKPRAARLRELFAGARVESLERSPTGEKFRATVKTPAGAGLELDLAPDPRSESYLVA